MVTEDFWLEDERVLLDDLLLLDVFDSLTEVGISQGNDLFVVVDVEAEGTLAAERLAEAARGWAVVAAGTGNAVAGFKLLTPEFSFCSSVISDTRELADAAETLASVLWDEGSPNLSHFQRPSKGRSFEKS